MTIVLNIIRYLILFALVVLLAGLFAQPIWNLYISIYHESGGSWIDLHDVAALILGYVFFLPLIFVMLGDQRSIWLIAVFYAPIVFFEFTSDFYGFFLFASIGLAGFLAGWLARLIVANTLGKIQALESLKRYF